MPEWEWLTRMKKVSKRTSEWASEWLLNNYRVSGWVPTKWSVSEWASAAVRKWPSELLLSDYWASQRVSEWLSKQVIQRASVWVKSVSERVTTSERVWLSEWILSEEVSEKMTKWVTTVLSHRVSEWLSEGTNEYGVTTERTSEWSNINRLTCCLNESLVLIVRTILL